MKALAVAILAVPALATADSLHADVEVDPTAYALDGDSVHVGVGTGRLRVDLGSFAERLPQFVHGDDGFDVSFSGFGAKLQVFLSDDRRGWFAGVDGGVLRILAQRQGSDEAATEHEVSVGVHAGYRIQLPGDFYVTPWLGVGYDFGARDITLAGATYRPSAISVFPAVHFGYAFR